MLRSTVTPIDTAAAIWLNRSGNAILSTFAEGSENNEILQRGDMPSSHVIRIAKGTRPERVVPVVRRRLEDGETAVLQAIGEEAIAKLLDTLVATLTEYAEAGRVMTGLGAEVPEVTAVLRVREKTLTKGGQDKPRAFPRTALALQAAISKGPWPDASGD